MALAPHVAQEDLTKTLLTCSGTAEPGLFSPVLTQSQGGSEWWLWMLGSLSEQSVPA